MDTLLQLPIVFSRSWHEFLELHWRNIFHTTFWFYSIYIPVFLGSVLGTYLTQNTAGMFRMACYQTLYAGVCSMCTMQGMQIYGVHGIPRWLTSFAKMYSTQPLHHSFSEWQTTSDCSFLCLDVLFDWTSRNKEIIMCSMPCCIQYCTQIVLNIYYIYIYIAIVSVQIVVVGLL